ncbi:competence type IV pilus minor pilin ComGD [Neobacillus kokaensis]|uniref:Competence protein ComG n=1 Tax=Neobacillus kokaensis TaxID=2759023 RepID=A0ABQ3N380_9BACI|nr:competence type IV pilus minor pilin ComGD [Neobacillus kokaensis]GHH96985.1 competence protein ComG [Neobacillus kokaensis]
MKNNQKGFTLAESLIVLSVFMILSTVTVFSLKPEHTMLEDEAFLTQLQADLYYAQNYALSHQHEVLFIIMQNQYFYKLSERTELPPFLQRSYSKSFYLTEGTIPLTIKFLPNGNVSKFGSFYIRTNNKVYRLTFLIGRGRFYVAEQ